MLFSFLLTDGKINQTTEKGVNFYKGVTAHDTRSVAKATYQ